MTSTRLLAGSLAATVFAAIVFLVWPRLDPAVAALFAQGGGHFVGDTALGRGLRRLFYWTPTVVFGGSAALYLARRLKGPAVKAPTTAGMIFLAASLALGPGLLVNVILKDHAHRPRPAQVTAAGGPYEYRPFWRFDGQCPRNCSFVSGESSTSFWTLAPALLTPPAWRAVAIAAAIVFGLATSLLRMAFGGHFLSDTVFAALFTWLVIVGCWRATIRLFGHDPRS